MSYTNYSDPHVQTAEQAKDAAATYKAMAFPRLLESLGLVGLALRFRLGIMQNRDLDGTPARALKVGLASAASLMLVHSTTMHLPILETIGNAITHYVPNSSGNGPLFRGIGNVLGGIGTITAVGEIFHYLHRNNTAGIYQEDVAKRASETNRLNILKEKTPAPASSEKFLTGNPQIIVNQHSKTYGNQAPTSGASSRGSILGRETPNFTQSTAVQQFQQAVPQGKGDVNLRQIENNGL